MKLFEMPTVEVVKFAVEDVITVSTDDLSYDPQPCL